MRELWSNSKKHRAPLFEAMAAHHRKKPASFHVPGHKSGMGADATAASFYEQILSIDYTEITGLDDLHQADGVILEAQHLAADCFGAEETLFLVGGSTVGNLAMISAVCEPGDILFVQRNVHKSVIHGLMLAGARAVFLAPQWDPEEGMAAGVDAKDVEKALQAYPEAKGLLITNPNYYGMGIDLKLLAELMHKHNKPLLVDEAHGAHFGFHPELPPSALSRGADIVVQSTHKMLSAMTMGAMLHMQGELINRAAVKQRLSILQSSSPSYPIMGSLDLARRQMHVQGKALLQEGLLVVKACIAELKKLSCYGLTHPTSAAAAYTYQDPFKIGIYDAMGTLSGPELRDQLEAYGCYAEMADEKRVLLVFTWGTTKEDAARIVQALVNICEERKLQKKEKSERIANKIKMTPFIQFSDPVAFQLYPARETNGRENQETEWVSIKDAIGKRSARMVIPYPPGIPLWYPGEWITARSAEYLQELAASGIKFQGMPGGNLQNIEVFT
ncbi:aminotransferase class I/II-fold pyridoxal phosphate-dependent enzyme [Paenibacillus sp. GP183]|uniref:aminotransferase class I/II-fold pyridoxal phosphate-dependent enzyme n=1 Tax=Paenibacillus sp. GP183 TaxID=1882751 RepID=UPI000894521F|nr:aminotransferase class I/II-fold pyridoxal phosphate-dependent enzyme [Paenibacillus sp. GP183]SEC36716.1 Arginine/lysine/ornithine decarboxylase [Paenibacillus sp. GP183]